MAITIHEFNEARTYCHLEKPTNWQKGRVVMLYVKTITNCEINRSDIPDDKLNESFENAKGFFIQSNLQLQ